MEVYSHLDITNSECENSPNFVQDTSIACNVKFNNAPLPKNKVEKRKRPYNNDELESKRLVEEEYNNELHEQRYKQLMHLLNKSQFYSSYIISKVNKTTEKTEKTKKTSKRIINDENIPLQKKKGAKRKDLEEYDIRKYIDIKQIEPKKNKNKLNLSSEEIEAELYADSDTETQTYNETVILPKYFKGDLYVYQQKGLQWLKVLYENGLSGILADEMGLGKTIQVIALICHLIEKQQSGPYLIIAPLSTIPNWIMEFKKFAPEIPVILFHGKSDVRTVLYAEIKRKYHIANNFKTQPIVITSFEIPLYETTFLQSQKWRYIIIDEGHRIKNHNCILVKNVKTLQSMNRLLLTGTPLQNNLAELWSLLNFLLPEIFNELAVFESWFDPKEFQDENNTKKILKQEKEKQILSMLREILKPFMLRREKSEVGLNIPPKKEVIVYAPLTELQHNLYTAVLNLDIQTLSKLNEPIIIPSIDGKRAKRRCVLRNKYGSAENILKDGRSQNISFIQNDNSNSNEEMSVEEKHLAIWKQYVDVTERNKDFLIRINFRNTLVMYKKIVNNPYLIHWPLNHVGLPKIDDDLIKSSGKLLVLDIMLAKLKAQGHKVLLFSTMTMILDIIEDYLSLRDYNYLRLDGNTPIKLREENIENFNNNPNIFLFLISTRAGAVGLNLAGADTVIIYDSDWNPQADIQAMARCHRIGQTKPVVIYRLCTKGTIDETIIRRAEGKRILEKMVISKSLDKNSLLKLKQLLESQEYQITTASKNAVFTESELNTLLDRSDLLNNMTNNFQKTN